MKLSKTCTQSQCSGTILACPWGSQSVPGFSFVLLWVTACPGSPNTNNQWDTDVGFHLLGKNQPRSESGLYLVRVEKTGVGAFVSQTHSLIYVMSGHSDLTTPTLPPLQMQQYRTIFTFHFVLLSLLQYLRIYGRTMKFNVTIEQRFKKFILP